MFRLLIFPVFVMAMLLSVNAAGDEGVLEINQTCAENDGCFAGDDPGFPVEITKSGSYALTSNLDVPAGTDGLTLDSAADGSSIDLNGFTIRGPETCEGTPVDSCTDSGFAEGISQGRGITVKNGVVSGMSRRGIRLFDGARVIGVQVRQNGGSGINVGEGSTVRDVVARRNGGTILGLLRP